MTATARDRRGRRELALHRDHGWDPVGRQHLERAFEHRQRKRVPVGAQKKRSHNGLPGTLLAGGLADRWTCRSSKLRDSDLLLGNRRIRLQILLGGEKLRNIH